MNQHSGLLPPSEPPGISSRMSKKRVAELVTRWFRYNFEDPANETPYDGREGGYLYIWGGPYEADDELHHHFAGVIPDEQIQAIAQELEEDCIYWAPAGWRVQPEEDDIYEEQVPPVISASKAYEELSRRIDKLEALLPQASGTAGLGHNNPPSDEQDAVLSNKDLSFIRETIIIFREQSPEFPEGEKNLRERTSKFKAISQGILRYLGKQADILATATSQATGAAIGACAGAALIATVAGVDLPSLEAIGTQLLEVANSAEVWLDATASPF